ncbi:MAG: ABC transporter ATP-binding protein [Candidatus Gastranaerophilales bacterium]|nr:ABC transporter ATP-binding protein [Candidatus Gastranaerophilales bacterium]
MKPIIKIENLVKEFPIRQGFFNKQVGAVYAVNNVTLNIYKGETLGLVGESGCGKSTAGRCIIGLEKATSGKIFFNDVDLTKLNRKNLRKLRTKMQIIFQNPFSSLNPRMTVKDILIEPLLINKTFPKKEMQMNVDETLELVGLDRSILNRFPHEFSGGQRQRIGIARALILKPEFIVADEPVSALDVSIQAQIINLLEDLKKELNLTYLFISHDLSVVKQVSNRVAVMYLGEIVEVSEVEELYNKPKHPYTEALLSAVPVPDPMNDTSKRIILKGDIPSPANPPEGCKFNTRCPKVMDICYKVHPQLNKLNSNCSVRCHLY